METVVVDKKDILKSIYFILNITQNSISHSMYGSLSSKGDLIGGIFDRWINTIPESIIFNKYILPEISHKKEVEVISDFYLYNPLITGIAPDVIGIVVNKKCIPFVVFDEKWIPVDNKPQIEIKTFKETQKMVSLRNQNYDEKYLIMIESNFRIDYLIPFFDKDLLNGSIYEKMKMNDEVFIKSNQNNLLSQIKEVDFHNDSIGTIKILSITKSKDFMDNSTHCEENVSVQRVSTISEYIRNIKDSSEEPLINYCYKTQSGLYRFNNLWYDGFEDEIPFFIVKQKSGINRKQLVRTLDFYFKNIEDVLILKKNRNAIYIISKKENIFNYENKLKANVVYKIEFSILDRSGNSGDEYFLQKELKSHIPDKKQELLLKLEQIIVDEK